jgi:hypothetical protein
MQQMGFSTHLLDGFVFGAFADSVNLSTGVTLAKNAALTSFGDKRVNL